MGLVSQDFSTADTCCLLKNALEKFSEESKELSETVTLKTAARLNNATSLDDRTLDRGMMETPEMSRTARYSDVNVVTVTGKSWGLFI